MPFVPPRATRVLVPVALVLAGLAGTAMLAGCTEPAAALKDPGFQQSASNLRDWQAAADRVVQSMADQGVIPGPLHPVMPGRMPYTGPFYINVMAQGSTFLYEVREAIEQDLMKRGIPIARVPTGATVLNLDIDVVQWGAVHPYPGGLLTAAGLAGAAGVALSTATPIGAAGTAIIAGAAGAAADAGIAIYPGFDTEAAWRATIVSGDRVVMKSGEVLYIASGDIPLYRGTVTLAAMSSPGVPVLSSTRLLRYAP